MLKDCDKQRMLADIAKFFFDSGEKHFNQRHFGRINNRRSEPFYDAIKSKYICDETAQVGKNSE
jgi:hypothetical protein